MKLFAIFLIIMSFYPSVFFAKRGGATEMWRRVWPLLNGRLAILAFGILAIQVSGAWLMYHYVPILFSISWTQMAFGTTSSIAYPRLDLLGVDENSLLMRVVVLIYLASLVWTMAFVVHLEESFFRKAKDDWKLIPLMSLIFGLSHMLLGISLGIALSIGIAGSAYHLFYLIHLRKKKARSMPLEDARNEAVLHSASLHIMVNSLIVLIYLWQSVLEVFIRS